MATAGLPATITVEFGFGSAPDAISPTWTDVSAYVDLGPGLTITPGRTAERNSISPRALSFTLDNRDGRFNPRNTGGPYYGDLVPRVPVRVRATYSATTSTLFRGFVDGGWPQDYTQLARTVPITAIDAVGWAATAPPPRSAYEGEITRLREVDGATLDGWLRPQSDGTWRDLISGHNFPHSAKFDRVDAGDSLTDGDEEGGWATDSHGKAWDKSVGKLTAPTFASGSQGLLVWWHAVDAVSAAASASVLFDIAVGTSRINVVFAMTSGSGTWGLTVGAWNGSTGDWTRHSAEVLGLFVDQYASGTPVMCAFARGADGTGQLWINGVTMPVDDYGGLSSSSQNWCVINDAAEVPIDAYSAAQNPWTGRLDHITWWTDTDSWGCTPDEAVAHLFEAGRIARAGDSMSERMDWLLGACGWDLVASSPTSSDDPPGTAPLVTATVQTPMVTSSSGYTNTATDTPQLDDSQIVTQQGYRRRNTVLELLQTIEDTEQGCIWVDREGRFRFSARSWPTADTVSSTVQATFGDTGSDLPYSASLSRIVDDDRQVVNVAEVTREYGTMQRSENTASIAAYGRRQPAGLSNLLYANDRQSRAVADWIVSAHGEPQARVEVLTFQPVNEAATLVPLACQIEPGWLIRVKRDGYQFDTHVVDVGHWIGMATWDVSLNLDATRAADLTGFTWDDGTGTVGTPWDDGTGTTSGAKGWVF